MDFESRRKQNFHPQTKALDTDVNAVAVMQSVCTKCCVFDANEKKKSKKFEHLCSFAKNKYLVMNELWGKKILAIFLRNIMVGSLAACIANNLSLYLKSEILAGISSYLTWFTCRTVHTERMCFMHPTAKNERDVFSTLKLLRRIPVEDFLCKNPAELRSH